ncbi:MAG: ThiF family adenylyltransferase [Candidatus Eremiobacteraeota bacterium]|nr:ThiF family adenylyltransferase [Candidatus Eremiobacteraeota bacterium]
MDTMKEYISRLEGIVSREFHEKVITVVGQGAGSYATEKLARLCPAEIRIGDMDTVEISNLSRTVYTMKDIGQYKVDALGKRIEEINPDVKVKRFRKDICQMDGDEIQELVNGADLIIAGTDQFKAQALLNDLSVAYNIPAIFIGVHIGALGGRIVWTIPGITPCYRCIARERFQEFKSQGDLTTDLHGARGSIIDCQFIDMIALKVSVAILERRQDSLMGKFFREMDFRNDIMVRCSPEYLWGNMVWDAILGDLPVQPRDYAREIKSMLFSMDSVWLKTEFDPNCPVCLGKPS